MSHLTQTIKAFAWSAALVMLLGLAGCGRGMGGLENYISQINARQGAPLEPLPEFRPYETFEYQAQDLRDPFGTGIAADAESQQGQMADVEGPKPDFDRRREPLESYELDSLAMVGTLELGENNWGLVKDPEGLLHRVKPGNYAGRTHGLIVAVNEDEIAVVELIADGFGAWLERDAALALDDE